MPLPAIGGKGLFTAELEQALRAGTIDLAVHSLKDLPTEETPGIALGAVCLREDVRDCLVARDGHGLRELPPGAVVGTSSLRRAAQLLGLRPRSRCPLDSRERGHARPQGARGRVRRRGACGCGCPSSRARGRGDRVAGARDDAPRAGSGRPRSAVPRRRRAHPRAPRRRSTIPAPARRRRPSACFSESLGAGCTAPVGAHAVRTDPEPGAAASQGRVRMQALVASAGRSAGRSGRG